MEANFFRRLHREADELLANRRIEKVFGPDENTFNIRLDSKDKQRFLLIRPARHAGLLFFSDTKPANPDTAPARVMWYRKRLAGRRILSTIVDWPGLRLALELSPRKEPGHGRYLIIDLRNDLRLADELDPAFIVKPQWPELNRVLDDPEVWREFPQISPPLRRHLTALEPEHIHRFYDELCRGSLDRAWVGSGPKGLSEPLLWPASEDGHAFGSALGAAAFYGMRVLFPEMERLAEHPEEVRRKRLIKKLKRALAKLDSERARLDELAALREQGELLRGELYRIKDKEKLDRVETPGPDGKPVTLKLDPAKSPVQNMERFFKLADKAKRGYVHLARRRNELGRQLAAAEAGKPLQQNRKSDPTPGKPAAVPKKYKGMDVSLFTSSDGFLIIRGKNKKANHQMLSKAASTFDWWLHAAHGPSSHVILKRDHPAQDVPERTLLEAAALCGLKSHQKDAGTAEVMVALVKDVRKVKGFDIGQVAVDEVLLTVVAKLDESLERILQRRP